MGEFFKFVFRFLHGWRRKTAAVTLVLALVLMACWVRSFVVEGDPSNTDHIDSTEELVLPGKEHAITGIGTDNHSLDSTEYQIVLYERDPATGSRFFSVNGSPVQGKLKAYLDAATEEGTLAIKINHPDGESSKWVEIPMTLFLSLTDHAPSL
jgi:hypothetical protein